MRPLTLIDSGNLKFLHEYWAEKAPGEIYQLATLVLSSISLTHSILQDSFREKRGLLSSFSIGDH